MEVDLLFWLSQPSLPENVIVGREGGLWHLTEGYRILYEVKLLLIRSA